MAGLGAGRVVDPLRVLGRRRVLWRTEGLTCTGYSSGYSPFLLAVIPGRSPTTPLCGTPCGERPTKLKPSSIREGKPMRWLRDASLSGWEGSSSSCLFRSPMKSYAIGIESGRALSTGAPSIHPSSLTCCGFGEGECDGSSLVAEMCGDRWWNDADEIAAVVGDGQKTT